MHRLGLVFVAFHAHWLLHVDRSCLIHLSASTAHHLYSFCIFFSVVHCFGTCQYVENPSFQTFSLLQLPNLYTMSSPTFVCYRAHASSTIKSIGLKDLKVIHKPCMAKFRARRWENVIFVRLDKHRYHFSAAVVIRTNKIH